MSCPSTAGPCCTHESCMDQPYPCSSVSHVEMAQRWLLGVCISNWLCTIPPNPSPTLSAHQHTLFVCVHTQHMHTSNTHTHTVRPFAPALDCLSFCVYFNRSYLSVSTTDPFMQVLMLCDGSSTNPVLSLA